MSEVKFSDLYGRASAGSGIEWPDVALCLDPALIDTPCPLAFQDAHVYIAHLYARSWRADVGEAVRRPDAEVAVARRPGETLATAEIRLRGGNARRRCGLRSG